MKLRFCAIRLITHGRGMDAEVVRSLPGAPHPSDNSCNTTIDSLSCGVPLVAIPITFEQPGNSARIRWIQTGEVISLSRLSVSKLRAAIQRVLTEPLYLRNAQWFRQVIQQAGGVERAAMIIEQAIATN